MSYAIRIMGFSETQLSIWSNQGATTSSALTYNSIKTCIDSINWNEDISYNIYLQGSYKNTTNIRGNSDVDIVVEFQSIFYSNNIDLSKEQLEEFNQTYNDGKYALDDFKSSIIEKLKDYYGKENIKEGDKSIKIIGQNGRLDADIVCCAEYRRYSSFSLKNQIDYNRGIVFWASDTKNKVVNFPIIHFKNGALKNTQSSGNYKSTTRIIKNMRLKLVELNLINKDLAPSYFLECLLFNLPANCFQESSNQKNILSILNHLNDKTDIEVESFYCQHRITKLFGGSDQQWNMESFKIFRKRLIEYWNNN